MSVFWGAARLQFALLRRGLDDLMVLVNAPLLTVAFLSIMRHAGRPDLEAYAVLGPTVISVFQMALLVSGELIAAERWSGTFEAALATPAPPAVALLGRISLITAVSYLSLAESWLVARLFGVGLGVAHPWLFVATLLVTGLAIAGSAVIMAAVFVVARSARTFQNALSYPFFLLGGAIVPVALLPGGLRAVSRVVFLSWSSDLLRDALEAAPVENVLLRLGVVLGLGLVGFGFGMVLLTRLLLRVRRTGSVALA